MSVSISKQDFAKAMYYGGLSVNAPQYPTTRDEYYTHDWSGGDVIDYWEDTAEEIFAMANSDADFATIMREAFLNTVERLEYCYKTRQDIINEKYEAQMELADAHIELDELRAKVAKLEGKND